MPICRTLDGEQSLNFFQRISRIQAARCKSWDARIEWDQSSRPMFSLLAWRSCATCAISLTFEEKLETAGNLIHDKRFSKSVVILNDLSESVNYIHSPQPLSNDIITILKKLCANHSVMAIMLPINVKI